MDIIISWIEGNLAQVALAVMGLLVLALILFIVNSMKMQRLMRKYKQLMRGITGANLEQLVEECLRELSGLAAKQTKLEEGLEIVEARSQSSLQGVGMVRFDAFRDSGGEQSFSMSIADLKGNGFVITSLYGREESYLYAKPLKGWQSSYALTEEEEQAIKQAWESVQE
jgi:hypothetical protein